MATAPIKMPGLPSLPPLNLASSSSASGHSTAGFSNDGFVVNFGNGSSVGGVLPQWLLYAAVIGGLVWFAKKKG